LDLQRQIGVMDERINAKMFELYDLRMDFDGQRVQLEDADETVAAWDDWVKPRVDADGHKDVVRLRVLLAEAEKEEDDAPCDSAAMESELAMAMQSEPSVYAPVMRAACMDIESKYKEVRAGYEAIDRVYCQQGLRRVLFEQEMRMMSVERQIRRGMDASARLRAEVLSLK
jgi:hypothetical protein